MKIEVPQEVEWIIGKIREHGFEAFAVGGCVRDTLLSRTPGDWDITTSAEPEEIKRIFPRTVDTGLQHGTVTVIKNRKGYEVTTYRIDGEYHDGRHPDSVEFTKNLTEDLKRRDFTINAMAYSHETGIVDVFGGMDDLKAGIIRCVGSPTERFSEDALRILRAIRFSGQLNFEIEEETLNAVGALAPNLLKVSRERIQTELTKLLLSDHPERLILTENLGISRYVADGLHEILTEGERPGEKSEGLLAYPRCLMGTSSLPAEKSMRWAGFLRFTPPNDVRRFLKGLKLDNETIGNAKTMAEGFQTPLPEAKTAIRRMASRMTEYQFEGVLSLKSMEEALPGFPGPKTAAALSALWQEILASGDCLRMKDMAVNGGDLIAAGMKPGKEMGSTLEYLFGLVLEHPEYNQKEFLLDLLKKGGAHG
ncbi:CCA tRNA nucleotidyltransferase [Eubacteriaceae bacterium Marseille-Q4139]|nr:CCA tRNA nucleotidyltransferase [Eubacteriaceae bacterium Marseille-Q4139]